MAVHEVRLPEEVERGSSGGPKFFTTILPLQSGFEKRNINWLDSRNEWDLSYGILKVIADTGHTLVMEDVMNFFYARRGRGHSFRFKDWLDYTLGRAGDFDFGQAIGLGDDSTVDFQIFKTYTSGANTYNRTIYKIVDGTYSVWVNNVLQVEGGGNDYTIDIDTGLITFNTAPASTGGLGSGGEDLVTVRCEFDNHVRFDTDKLDMDVDWADAARVPSIPIVEIRGAA